MRKSFTAQHPNLVISSQQNVSNQWKMHVSVDSRPEIEMLPHVMGSDPSAQRGRLLHLHLRALGVSPKLAGYRCLLAVIPMLAENPGLMMKEVYPVVAHSCGLADARCVEHVVRLAIHKAWANRYLPIWACYFPVNRDGDIDRPTNKEFIARLAEEI